MSSESQPTAALPGLDLPPSVAAQALPGPAPAPRVKPVDRSQAVFRSVCAEDLVGPDHPVRAIWEFVGRLDLELFYAPIESVQGGAGRPCWDPRLLISLLIYAYSQGISSGREICRRCQYDPAFQWLSGLEQVNYHTLSDFRSGYAEPLQELFIQALGVLSAEGLVRLERVMQDGTKVKAFAAKSSFGTQDKLQKHLAAARQQVEALKDWEGEQTAREQAARKRAACERQSRVEEALQQLERVRQTRSQGQAAASARVSHTDPEARIMKQADGGFAPSYNVQLSTDAAHKIIVAAGVSQNGNDFKELVPALERIERNRQALPQQMVVDAGFTTRANIVAADAKAVELTGVFKEAVGKAQLVARGTTPEYYPEAFVYDAQADTYRCPRGEVLKHIGQKEKSGALEHTYRAARSLCAACPVRDQCCGSGSQKPRSVIRMEEPEVVRAFRLRMQTQEAQQIYRQRSAVAEFPNAWIKQKLGLRQFRLRGLLKVQLEVLWASLTYNLQQWIRLRWLPLAG